MEEKVKQVKRKAAASHQLRGPGARGNAGADSRPWAEADSQPCTDALPASAPCRASVQWRLAQLVRLLAQRQQDALSAHGLDLRAYATLVRLEHAPCATQLALARQSRVDKSTLVAILDLLEKAGWVERIPDARDRRARIVRATEAGKAKLAVAHACIRATEDAVLGALDTGAREVFIDALATLTDAG